MNTHTHHHILCREEFIIIEWKREVTLLLEKAQEMPRSTGISSSPETDPSLHPSSELQAQESHPHQASQEGVSIPPTPWIFHTHRPLDCPPHSHSLLSEAQIQSQCCSRPESGQIFSCQLDRVTWKSFISLPNEGIQEWRNKSLGVSQESLSTGEH